MESDGGDKDSKEEEGSFSFGSDQLGSKLSSINCLGCFDSDLGIFTIEFCLTNRKETG